MDGQEGKKEFLLFLVIPYFAGENKEDIRARNGAAVFFSIDRALRERTEREAGRRRHGKGKNWQTVLCRWVPRHMVKLGPRGGQVGYLWANLRGWRVLSDAEIQEMLLEQEVERGLAGLIFNQVGTVTGRLSTSKPNLAFPGISGKTREAANIILDYRELETRLMVQLCLER